ncbi:MAG: hypothetical protein WCS73_10755 [Lentisphaeria bacterium]
MPKILFVCNNNRSRSPMAAAYFAKVGELAGIKELEVVSAGIWGRPEEMIDPKAVKALNYEKLEPQRLGCTLLTLKVIRSSDLILGMSEEITENVRNRFVSAKRKTKNLMSMVGLNTGVFDPHGGNLERYLQCLNMMKPALDELAERLR